MSFKIGDKVKIKVGDVEQEFTIKSIVKDSVFGSAMMGFKRLIISEEDFRCFDNQKGLTYAKLYAVNCDDEEAFENAFQKKNFNVVANVDKSTIEMCYVFDMLIAGILIIVSICLILIAFMVLRFTILFTLQEDYKEIGIMKALGCYVKDIRRMFLFEAAAIGFSGGLIGLLLSYAISGLLNMLGSGGMSSMMGDGTAATKLSIIPIWLALLALFFSTMIGLIAGYAPARRAVKISALEAIRTN